MANGSRRGGAPQGAPRPGQTRGTPWPPPPPPGPRPPPPAPGPPPAGPPPGPPPPPPPPRRYHRAESPNLARVSRATFARQAANLWRLKQLLQERLARRLACGDPVWLVDGVPVEACPFARATSCKLFTV